MSTLAALLKASRSLQGHTLRDVEQLIGLSNPYLSQIENGKAVNITASVIFALAGYMKMKPEEVLRAVEKALVSEAPHQMPAPARTKYCFAPCPPEQCDCMEEEARHDSP